MKKLALRATNRWLSYLLVRLQAVASIVFILGALEPVHATDFFCRSGNVICLIVAINDANGLPGAHTINLEPGIYTLTQAAALWSGLPEITSTLTIRGAAAETTIIERDASAPEFSLLKVEETGTLKIEEVTLRGGSQGVGGGIWNDGGIVTIVSTIVAGNRAGRGGGIFSGHRLGTVNIINSTLSDNMTDSFGGGVFNHGTLIIRNSALYRNSANTTGFAISNEPNFGVGGVLIISNTTIANNTSVSIGGRGGAVYNATGEVSITNSTIAGNTAQLGDNGGLVNVFLGTVALQNTILARNTAGRFGRSADCSGPVTSLGNNLIGDTTGCDINLQSSDLTGDPGLGAFVNSGAPENGRFPLLETSRAINHGNNQVCSSEPTLATDQLDTPRNGPCDIGAVEFYPIVNDLLSLANVTTAFDPTPVPGGPAGIFRITADFANTSSQAIIHPFAELVELTGENLLLNADGGAGGVGARVTLPDSATTAFQPGASNVVEFLIGLQQRQPFTFFVNILGEP